VFHFSLIFSFPNEFRIHVSVCAREGLSQEEAGEKMGVSRGTVWRLLQNARKKTAQALTEGRPLQITKDQSINET